VIKNRVNQNIRKKVENNNINKIENVPSTFGNAVQLTICARDIIKKYEKSNSDN
jgi:hypothetical protein